MKSEQSSVSSPLPGWLAATPAATAVSRFYGAVIHRRSAWYDLHPEFAVRVRPPVISIGGIRAGGTGKTPTVMLLVELLQRQGYTVGVLSRGYKRTGRDPVIIAPAQAAVWEQTGDEPAMIKTAYPDTWLGIGGNRAENATLLEKRMSGRAVFLLDDGFQHRKLHRDVDIVCIHDTLFSDRLLPQGWLREPPEALRRADIFLLIGTREQKNRFSAVGERLAALYPGTPQFTLYQQVVSWVNVRTREEVETVPFSAPVALCGIARPERFFKLVEAEGVKPCKKVIFPDHYRYTDYDISLLRKLYSQGLITTEKDAVRLTFPDEIAGDCLWYLKVRLQFSENKSFNRFNHYIKAVLDQKCQSTTW